MESVPHVNSSRHIITSCTDGDVVSDSMTTTTMSVDTTNECIDVADTVASSSPGNSGTTMVVNVSFYDVICMNNRDYPYKKVGRSFLELEVLDHHTLRDLAKALFKHCLNERYGEGLNSHIWRFEPFQGRDCSGMAFNRKIPILSREMGCKAQYSMFQYREIDGWHVDYSSLLIKEGMDLLFFYDEGDTRLVAVSIDKISPIPVGKSINDYPCKKGGVEEEEMN
jgi:hypothetical protein